MIKYVFVRDVLEDEWGPLPQDFKKGDVIYRFSGHDYGCARDDAMYGGRETISCSTAYGVNPFFTVPVEFISLEDGTPVSGGYMTPKHWKEVMDGLKEQQQ